MSHAKRKGKRILIRAGHDDWSKCSETAARQVMNDIADALAEAPSNGDLSVSEARQEKGWSQSQLAAMVGMSRTYLSEIERGEAHNISLDMARRIASVLGYDVDELF